MSTASGSSNMDQIDESKMDDPMATVKHIMIGINMDARPAATKSPEFSSPMVKGGDSNKGSDEDTVTEDGRSVGSHDPAHDIDNKTDGQDAVLAAGNETNEEEHQFTPNETSLETFISEGELNRHKAGYLYTLYLNPLLRSWCKRLLQTQFRELE